MGKSAEQGSEQASNSRVPGRARRYGSKTASPVTVVTDDDYRCIWRPCDALEVDEAASPSESET